MEELYIEPFSTKTVSVKAKEAKPPNTLENSPNVQLAEVYEVINSLNLHLDQLEKLLFKDYENFADFQFFFQKIRDKLKQKNAEGIFEILSELEDIIDAS